MIRRICGIALLAVVLLGLVIYSQMRPQISYVSGLIEAEEIRLGSRVGGRVKAVLVNEGDQVPASAPLVEFEPYDLREREQEAIAILAERDAAHQRLAVTALFDPVLDGGEAGLGLVFLAAFDNRNTTEGFWVCAHALALGVLIKNGRHCRINPCKKNPGRGRENQGEIVSDAR